MNRNEWSTVAQLFIFDVGAMTTYKVDEPALVDFVTLLIVEGENTWGKTRELCTIHLLTLFNRVKIRLRFARRLTLAFRL